MASLNLSPFSLLCCSVASLGTWRILNRHDLRGDYALCAFAAGFGALYYGVHSSSNSSTGQESMVKSIKLFSAYTMSLILATVFYRLSSFHPLAGFPGPILWRISSLYLSASSYHGYRHLTLDRLHKKYGKFVRIGPNHLSIHSPSAANVLYSSHNMEKSHSYDNPGHVPGVSLFFKHTREEHTARKRIWSAGFTTNAFTQYCYPMDRRVWQLIQYLQERANPDGFVDLAEALAHWSYDFMGEMVFGGCNDLELMENGDKENLVGGGKMAMTIVDAIGQSPWLLDIIWHLPASQDIHKLRHASIRMMKNRAKSRDVDIQDVSSYLLAGDPATGDYIPDRELAIDALVAIQAGSDNTATLLGLAFYFLLADRSTYRKLRIEVDANFPNPKDSLELDTLTELPYLNAVVLETLRLGTPFFLPRIIPPEGVVIDDVCIPPGSIVALAAYTQQTSEENFGPDPLTFRPDRWFEEGADKSAIVSFSSGRFACIAKTFAMHELRFVLARLVLNLDIRLKPEFDVEGFRRGIRNMRTTTFDHPLLVEIAPR